MSFTNRIRTLGSAAVVPMFVLAQAQTAPEHTARNVTLFKLIAMLILLVLGGAALVVWAWLTLRVGRRQIHRPGGPLGSVGKAMNSPVHGDDWARKPLHDNPQNASGENSDQPSESA